MIARFGLAATTTTAAAAGLYAHTLHRRLHTDQLTSLGNRDALQRAFTRTQRRTQPGGLIGLLLCDLDRFKQINDRYGHRFGDRALQLIAHELRQFTTGCELPIRLHGDEFAVLLPALDEVREAETRARALRQQIATTRHALDGVPLQLSLSVGAAVDTASHTDLSALLNWADARMYRTKHEQHVTTLPTSHASAPRLRELPKESA